MTRVFLAAIDERKEDCFPELVLFYKLPIVNVASCYACSLLKLQKIFNLLLCT